MGLSIGAFAKLVGVSHEAIRKGIKSGRLVLSSDGTIDEMTQVERWHATRDPSKVRGSRPMTASTPEASASAVAKFDQLKTAEKALQVQLLQEELRQVKAETVNRDEVRRSLTAFARLIRDKWVNFPNRYGQQIAAEVGCEPKNLMASLDRFVRLQLDEIANAKPTLPE
ncbi:hypothetical protein C2U72_05545 [Prosthecomicrobium hirschii]|uniref:hypothetical protein n=1 Tax=Prosthecodimorpha hirschii TaxID=665126 RepID=UPI00112CEFAF|nr:hypothetical protein [Prosthecomicrobium hirschii]TPQ51967.1 hypothetical protein C2U72_05545 [Prosthecomicrobium hirschii]